MTSSLGKMGFIEFILVFLWVADFFLWWLCLRNLASRVRGGWRWALHGFFIAQILFMTALYLGNARSLSAWIPRPAYVIFYVWHLLVAPMAFGIGLLGLAGEGMASVYRFFRPKREIFDADDGGFSRREFLGTLAACVPPLLTFSLSAVALRQLSNFRVRQLTVVLPTLPPALDGMTVVHLSDLHMGQFTRESLLREVVEETNRLQPDLTFFTGDLINSSLEMLPRGIEVMKALRSPLVLCEGNHDVGLDRDGFERTLKASGLGLLLNEALTLRVRGVPVQILGIAWEGPHNWKNRGHEEALSASVETVLRLRDPEAFHILLAHHPHAWDYCGEVPLTLSGHTHGGQLMLDSGHGFGPLMFRYWSGLYTRAAAPGHPARALVVSNGVGNWYPIRVGAPAEIIHLTLRRG